MQISGCKYVRKILIDTRDHNFNRSFAEIKYP